MFYLKNKLEKEQSNPKVSRRKEKIKQNLMKKKKKWIANRKHLQVKGCLFENISNMEKPLTRLIKK